jgi:hypothetical protein
MPPASLYEAYPLKELEIDHQCRIGPGGVSTTRALMRLQPVELQHTPMGLRRVYDEIATAW